MKRIQIFGGRCSGTNYVTELIKLNFKNARITDELGHKHLWDDPDKTLNVPSNVGMVLIVRNPFDWIRSIHKEPHHFPDLIGISFDHFIRSRCLGYFGDNWNHPIKKIREGIKNENNLIEDYVDVFEMRRKKLSLLFHLKKTFPNTVLIRLEDLQSDTEGVLTQIAKGLNLEQNEVFVDYSEYKNTGRKYYGSSMVKISNPDMNYVVSRFDWEIEERLGYNKEDYKHNRYIDVSRIVFRLRSYLHTYILRHLGYQEVPLSYILRSNLLSPILRL